MRKYPPNHRKDDFKPLCTSISDNRFYTAAQLSCDALREGICCIDPQPDVPPPYRTFDEQIALVLAGKARVIPVLPICKADPVITLGGVSW